MLGEFVAHGQRKAGGVIYCPAHSRPPDVCLPLGHAWLHIQVTEQQTKENQQATVPGDNIMFTSRNIKKYISADS